jgi:cytochrome c-type biogenesis protein CcsB
MRNFVALPLALLVLSLAALAPMSAARAADWNQWRSLPVLDGGRHKPLDTMAREALRIIAGRTSFTDPESGETLDATAAYLTMLFDWQADKPAADAAANPHGAAMSPHGGGMNPRGAGMSPHGAGGMGGPAGMAGGMASHSPYFRNHQPDKWDQAPLILVDSVELRAALEMPAGKRHIAPWDLSQAEVLDPRSEKKMYFLMLKQMLSMRGEDAPLSDFEKGVLETAGRLRFYQDLRMGLGLAVVPIQDSEVRAWEPVGRLAKMPLDERTDPTALLRQVNEQYEGLRAAYRDESAEAFDAAAADLLAALREIGPQLGDYPSAAIIDLEVAYNHWPPFRIAWVLTAIAAVGAAVSLGVRARPVRWAALACLLAASAAMIVGFVMRTIIAGRAPVTSMYETVIFVALGVAIVGLICGSLYRQGVILLAAAAVATLTLVLADPACGAMNADIHPLMPILRDNFWLIIHVKVIMASYAAFALALGIGNVTLGHFLVGSQDRPAIAALSKFTYRTLQVGVFLLAAGTITGAMWGDYAWGRFWGWDSKEVWALISLLAYVAVLHLRYVGWLGYRSLAALSVTCFMFIIVTWYAANYLLAGLHSYGSSGNAALPYIAGAAGAQLLYVGIALLRSTARNASASAGMSHSVRKAAAEIGP